MSSYLTFWLLITAFSLSPFAAVARAQTQTDQQAKDAAHKAGDASNAEGMRLYRAQTPESYRQAIESFKAAAASYHAAGDIAAEANALNNTGGVYNYLNDRDEATGYFTQALTLYQGIGDFGGQAISLNNLGTAYSRRGENRRAIDYFEQALKLRQSVGDKSGEAITLVNLGFAFSALGEPKTALDYYSQALALQQATGDRRNQATTLNNIAKVSNDLGQQQKALDNYTQALALFRQLNDRVGEARALSNIGQVYDELGEKEKALDYYNQALPLRRAVGDSEGEAATLSNIGSVYDDLGDKQKAIEYYTQALPPAQSAGDQRLECTVLNNMGHAYSALGEKQKALDYYAQSLPVRQAIGDKDGQAVTLNNIGAIYDDLGDNQKSLDNYGQALALYRAALDRDGEATTLNNLGLIYYKLGDQQKALDYFDQALPMFRELRDPLGEANTLEVMMTYWRKANRPDLAILFGKQAIDRYQLLRRNISGLAKETQDRFLKYHEDAYRQLAGILIDQGRLTEAQEVLDKLKLEEFSQFTQHRGETAGASSPVALTAKESASATEYGRDAAEIAAIGGEWAQLHDKPSRTPEEDARLDDLSTSLAAANDKFQAYLKQLYGTFGKNDAANTRATGVDDQTSDLQGLLADAGPGTVFVYTLVLDDKCGLIVITPSIRVAHEVPITKLALRSKVFNFNTALNDPDSGDDLKKASLEIYNILVAPIEKDLQGAKAETVVWSLDDVLRYVPVAALYDGKQFLVERYRTAVITAANVGNLKDKPHVAQWTGLAMGVSKDFFGLGALTAVPGELDSVVHNDSMAGSHGPVAGTILLNDSFTERNMEAGLEKHPPLVHIASHYSFTAGDDSQSYLLLGGKDAGGDGFKLSLEEIRSDPRMDFGGIELLTLSGCQTAVGSKDADGREIDGLGIVAQRKHAKAVIATLWPVDDASVGKLMATFYETWTRTPGMTKAAALRQAQLSLLHGAGGADGTGAGPTPYASPYYWAPFILIGNWK
jgi:CHAT domain-containing protein/tetratricopeptide (TPR) repeat protein